MIFRGFLTRNRSRGSNFGSGNMLHATLLILLETYLEGDIVKIGHNANTAGQLNFAH
jgi:hypothetical protein